jgi:hypothetical protein
MHPHPHQPPLGVSRASRMAAVPGGTMHHLTFAVATSAVLLASAIGAFGLPVLLRAPVPKAQTITVDFRLFGRDFKLTGTLDGTYDHPSKGSGKTPVRGAEDHQD